MFALAALALLLSSSLVSVNAQATPSRVVQTANFGGPVGAAFNDLQTSKADPLILFRRYDLLL